MFGPLNSIKGGLGSLARFALALGMMAPLSALGQAPPGPAHLSDLPPQIAHLPSATQKLAVIHKQSQFMVVRQRVRRFAIADPSVIDIVQYSPTELSILGLGLGTTNLVLWFEGHPEPLIYEVAVVPDPALQEKQRLECGRLEQKLAILFPNSQVHLIPLSGKIVVKGQAHGSEEAARILQIVRGQAIDPKRPLAGPVPPPGSAPPGRPEVFAASRIVNMLEVPGEFQVMLRVRIAELSRSRLRRMGLDLSALIHGRHFGGTSSGGSGGTTTGLFDNGEIAVLLDWLESHGTAKILSEPTLTVLSGHSASFLSGGEFAVPTVVGIDGAKGQTTTFRGFGTSVVVTPTVIDRDLIRMHIVPEFSQANPNLSVDGIPGLTSRRVQTTVELREGQTIAIAGLISHRSATEVSRAPWLSELPVVGPWLFAHKRSAQEETELLVLVTPELVRPMDAEDVPPVPGTDVTPPNNREFYHGGRTEGCPYPSQRPVPLWEGTGYRTAAPPGLAPSMAVPYETAPSRPGYSVEPLPPRIEAPAPR